VIVSPALLALGLVLGLLILLPARRLQLAGFSSRAVGTVAAILWFLALTVAAVRGPTRILVPVLLIAYLLPFVASPDQLGRIVRRGGTRGRPMKDVTPHDQPGPDGR